MTAPVSAWRGRRVWLLGATSSLGSALAAELADLRAGVAISGGSEPELTVVAARRMTVVPADLTRTDDLKAALDAVTESLGGLDAVIVCAHDDRPAGADGADAAGVRQALLAGPTVLAAVADLVLPVFSAQGGGALVGITGGSLRASAAERAASAAMTELLSSLRRACRQTPVHVQTVHASAIRPAAAADGPRARPEVAARTVAPAEAAVEIADAIARGRPTITFPPRAAIGRTASRLLGGAGDRFGKVR